MSGKFGIKPWLFEDAYGVWSREHVSKGNTFSCPSIKLIQSGLEDDFERVRNLQGTAKQFRDWANENLDKELPGLGVRVYVVQARPLGFVYESEVVLPQISVNWLELKQKNESITSRTWAIKISESDFFEVMAEQKVSSESQWKARALVQQMLELNDEITNSFNRVKVGIGSLTTAKDLGQSHLCPSWFKFVD